MSYEELVERLKYRTLAFRDSAKGIRMRAKIVGIKHEFSKPYYKLIVVPEGRKYRSEHTCFGGELECLAKGQEVDRSSWHMETLLVVEQNKEKL